MSEQPKVAVFVTVRLPNGNIAATTRVSDTEGAGKIGLPGGKVDAGETLLAALEREAAEEGWMIEGLQNSPYHSAMVGPYECHWFAAQSATALAEYKEKGRIEAIEVEIEALKTPGLGNDRAMARFEALEASEAVNKARYFGPDI